MKILPLYITLLCIGIAVQSQEGVLTIHQNNRIASLQLSSTDYNSWVANDEFRNDGNKKRALTQNIYESFSDEFDFIFYILNEEDTPTGIGYAGVYSSVSNAVQGIGANIFDFSVSYGSSGKLKGVIQIPSRRLIMNGPTLHELMHNWANRAIDANQFDRSGNSVSSGSHWGYVGGSSKGQLGGFDISTLIENGNNSYTVDRFGSFANGGNSIPYNELELYLMGMIPASELSDFEVFTGLSNFSSDPVTRKYTFSATTRTVYTPSMLVAKVGERIPNSVNSQKDFRILTIVLTDTPLTEAEWNTIDEQIERFGRSSDEGTNLLNFWEATGGRGTLDVENIQNALSVSSNQLREIVGLKIHPIPVKNKINISINNSYTIEETEIYNLLGQKIISKTWSTYQNNNSINTQNLDHGTYILAIKINGYSDTIYQRILKN